MARPRDKKNPVCQNHECAYFRKEKGKNVVAKGINRAGHRQFFCLHCRKYFVSTKGTPLYNRKLSERAIKDICKELVEKKGIRAIERTTKHHRDTIGNLIDDLAAHAASMTDYLVHDVGLEEHEVDELWSFVKKTKRKPSLQAVRGLAKVSSGSTPA